MPVSAYSVKLSLDQLKRALSFTTDVKTPYTDKHEKKYGIPTLEELGYDTASLSEEKFPGGEQEALKRLDEHMKRTVLWFHKVYFFFFFFFLGLGLQHHLKPSTETNTNFRSGKSSSSYHGYSVAGETRFYYIV